jgi:hypothetical protein
MPDITKCDNSDCPSCTICWRFMAKPNTYQSYGIFQPDGDKCSSFWPSMVEPMAIKRKENL